MADQNLRAVLGSKYKSYNYGSSCSQTAKQKRIVDLETLAQHLQQRLRLYEDHNSMENLMEGIGKYKFKEEKYNFYEETLQPSQLQGFLGHKKAKGMYPQDYDYHGRYDGYYWKMLVNFWIGLIWWSMSLGIMTLLSIKR